MRLFHKRFLPIAMAVAVVTAVPPSLFARCGVERWSVKTGTDSDATQVRLTVAPTPTTISDLISLTPPHPIPKAHRISPTETTVWTVDAILTDYKIEDARSYHPGIVEAILWVLSQWSISSQEGSGRAVFIPRIISSITSGWMSWK
jgi:hypothetical protein